MCAKGKDGRDPDSGNTTRGVDAQPDIDETVETDANNMSDPELIRGKVLADKYEIIAHLGSGAMGAVYKARHQILKKEVAVKILLSTAVSDSIKKERFMREAKAQGGLSHRNIAAVHDFGFTENNQPFFVMDLLNGQTLEEDLEKQKSLTVPQFISIFEQVARGLHHAHSKGIIHRDIKPSNIMLIDSDEGELQALVVDFGIAVSEDNESGVNKLTKTGFIIGTPHYMSPEQIEAKPLDARSDIYSLGCVMFEALTGNPPFSGSSVHATMALHLAQQPENITSFKTKSTLPDGIADLVMRCLEKDPNKRFANAKEIAARLNDLKKEKAADKKHETKQKGSKNTDADENLVSAGKGRKSKNPAHSPTAPEAIPNENKPDASEKFADKIELTEGSQPGIPDQSVKNTDGSTGGTSDSGSSSAPAKEAELIKDQSLDESDTLSPGQTNSPTLVAQTPVENSEQTSTGRQLPDGHDIITLVVLIVVGIFIWPEHGRLALPIDPNEMRDDNPFFMLAKFIVASWNQLANHPFWQFAIFAFMLYLVFCVMQKLLKSGPND